MSFNASTIVADGLNQINTTANMKALKVASQSRQELASVKESEASSTVRKSYDKFMQRSALMRSSDNKVKNSIDSGMTRPTIISGGP